MARSHSPRPFRDFARWRAAWLAGVCVLSWQSAEAATAPRVTDPRIIERYKQMLAANPVEGTALERLWKIAEDEGFAGKLLEESGEAAAKGGFKEQMVYGLLLRRSGKDAEAIASFRKASESDPKSPLPHLALAPLLPPVERAAELEAAVALTPNDAPTLPDQLQQLGDAWMIAGEPEKAADAWEKIVARSKGNLELRQKLAKIYAEKGMHDRALAHLAVLEKESDPARRVEALRAMARVQTAGGDPDAALASLTKAFGLTAPGHWMRRDLTAEMIRTAQEGGQLETLKERWTAETVARPGDPAPWLQLADLNESEGALEAERAALEKAADLAPTDAALQIRLARLRLRLDDPAGAAAAYDRVPVDPKQPDPDLAFERAELDVRQGKPEAAQQRIEAVAAAMPEDAALGMRVVTFYRDNRMHAALEKLLRKPGNDPVTLAEYLFAQRRPDEARAVLQGLVRSGDTPEKQAAAHQKASDLYKQVGDPAAAVESLRAATMALPDSAPLQLALGELLLSSPSGKKEARQAFSHAYALATTDEARLEADQRLFRVLELGDDEETAASEDPSTWSEARRAATALLSVPLREGGDPASASTTTSLQGWIEELRQTAEKSGDPASQLRLARWAFWSRDLHGALAAAKKASDLDPKAVAPRELVVSIELAGGNRSAAIEQLQALAQIAPERKEAWQKQIAQTRFQMGQSDEAIQILEELAETGETGALTDLAQGQQQGDRWYDALGTWEKLYQRSKGAKRAEVVQPIVRAMQRLEMNKRAAEFLWEAFCEQTDEAARNSLLNDLILHCRNKGMTRWMVAQLEARAASGDPADVRALAQVLKATGRGQEAFEQLQRASRSSKDRPAAEEELVRQAEELRDFAKAAEHQQLRLKFLPTPAAADWEKLAQLQENALDYAAADETRQQIARRFPRDSEALLKSARYFNKWGDTKGALELLRRVRQVDPGNLEGAVWLIRNAAASDAERRKAATDLLAVAPSTTADAGGLVLPPESEPFGNRLRACFATLSAGGRRGSEVKAWDENAPSATEAGWRLEAIRYLAARLSHEERPAWVARWSAEKSRPSETLWALAGAGAHPELFAFLREINAAAPDDKGRAGALIWYGLRLGAWNELAEWLWNPQRKREDQDTFRMLLGEWTALRLPLDPALFAKAIPSEAWSAAEVLAVRRRYADAAAIGRRLFEAMPSPRGAVGLPLADWLLNAGDTASAIEIYTEIAKEPAASLDAPSYAAQRALYLLLPELERNAWMADLLASLQPDATHQNGSQNGSPVHAALSSALLHTLSGQTLAANAEWRRLASLRAGVVEEEVPAVDRAWAFLLGTGVQLQQWGLYPAALTLWEQAVADPAAIRLQGERATAFAEEIQTRLAAIRLMRADRSQVEPILEEIARTGVPASLNPLAGVLEAEGCRALSVQVLEAMQKSEARTPVMRLLAACTAVGDTDRAWEAVKRWEKNPGDDSVSAPAVLDFLAANDPPRALETAEELAVSAPGDQRVLERLAQYRYQAGQFKEAAEIYRKLIVMQPSLAGFRVGLADALAAQGNREAALEELKSAPKNHPLLEVKTVELLAASGAGEEARIVAASLLRGNEPAPFIKAVQSLAKEGRKHDALTLLSFAVDEASTANKSRAAFQLQREGVRLVGGDAVKRERWVRRLKSLAGTRPDFLAAYFETTGDSTVQSPATRYVELVEMWDDGAGSPVAGSWLVSVLLERNPKGVEAVLDRLLAHPDMTDGLLVWLDTACKSGNRHDLALLVNDRLMQRLPEEVSTVLSRVASLRALGRTEEASQLIEAAQARSVLAPALNGQLALAAQEIGSTALARRLFTKAINADPAALKSAVFLGYARLLVEEGDFTAAKRILRQAYRNPENRDTVSLVEYLKRSGRPVASEVRDLELPPSLVKEVEARMAH